MTTSTLFRGSTVNRFDLSEIQDSSGEARMTTVGGARMDSSGEARSESRSEATREVPKDSTTLRGIPKSWFDKRVPLFVGSKVFVASFRELQEITSSERIVKTTRLTYPPHTPLDMLKGLVNRFLFGGV